MVEFSFAYPFSLYNIYVGVKIGANLKAWSGFHHHHQEDLKKEIPWKKTFFRNIFTCPQPAMFFLFCYFLVVRSQMAKFGVC